MKYLRQLVVGSAIGAAAALATAGGAFADGMRAPAGAAPQVGSWSGFYFGAGTGWQWSSIQVGPVANPETDHDSEFVGAYMGLQHQFGNIVLGVEGGWNSTFRNNTGNYICPNPAFSCEVRLDDILTIGGRLGVVGHPLPMLGSHSMLYLTGGYANGAFHYFARTPANTGPLSEEARTRNSGWYIGGGVEWRVSPGWTTGIEYRHYEFDTGSSVRWTPAGATLSPITMDASSDTVMFRATWTWDRPAPVRPLK